MARREVLEILCDRCKKVEVVPKEVGGRENKQALSMTYYGQPVTYGDLCKRCRGALDSYFKKISLQQADDEDIKDAGASSVETPQKGLLQRIHSTGGGT